MNVLAENDTVALVEFRDVLAHVLGNAIGVVQRLGVLHRFQRHEKVGDHRQHIAIGIDIARRNMTLWDKVGVSECASH